jgi:hypothetical protein
VAEAEAEITSDAAVGHISCQRAGGAEGEGGRGGGEGIAEVKRCGYWRKMRFAL